jgi:hypothetical protein
MHSGIMSNFVRKWVGVGIGDGKSRLCNNRSLYPKLVQVLNSGDSK